MIGGGLETGAITQIFGEGGSGKSNLCILIAINAVKNGRKVIFIDTEGLSIDRFEQMAGPDAKEIAKNIIFYEPTNFKEQHSVIKDLGKITNNIGVIIVDSATSLYRVSSKSDQMSLIRELGNQMTYLVGIARKQDIAVVITNQVYTDMNKGIYMPIGGNILCHLSKTIIKLEKLDKGLRRATLLKHRSLPEGASIDFKITNKGIE
jgi:DNA repair protein RadB